MKHKEITLKKIINKDISSFQVPDYITRLDGWCFYQCSISSVQLSKNLKSISKATFYKCKELKKVNLINCINLINIEEHAFVDCQSLGEIYIPDRVKLGRSVFWDCWRLKRVRLPSDLEIIPSESFRGCISLTDIDIPSSVVEIEEYAFLKSGIKEINISKKVRFSKEGHETIEINYID